MLEICNKYSPDPRLKDFVQYYIEYDYFADEFDGTIMTPEGIVEVVFQFNIDTEFLTSDQTSWQLRSNSFVGGLHTKNYLIRSKGNGKMLSIKFKPGGFSCFIHFSVMELENRLISLEDIWGIDAENLYSQLEEEPIISRRIKILDNFLINKILTNDYYQIFLDREFQKNFFNQNVKSFADSISLSYSYFKEIFKNVIGTTPKNYQKIIRVNKSLELIKKQNNLMDIVFLNGYCDQAHFIKEFRSITSIKPSLISKNKTPNYYTDYLE